MFLGNTASEIFIPRHFLFALPLSKVCAMRAVRSACLDFAAARDCALSAVLYANLLSHFYLWFSRCHTVHFSQNLYADPEKKNQLTIWTFSTCCTIWVGQTCRQNKSKQTKHMNNRSKSYSQSKSQSLQLHASCQFDFDFDYLNLHWPLIKTAKKATARASTSTSTLNVLNLSVTIFFG